MNGFRWGIERSTSIQREMQKFEKETMYTPQTEEKGDTPKIAEKTRYKAHTAPEEKSLKKERDRYLKHGKQFRGDYTSAAVAFLSGYFACCGRAADRRGQCGDVGACFS